jgi:UDP-N-acetylmuramate dehydrogenase
VLYDRIAPLVASLKMDEPLKNHTTYRVGGAAKYFVEVHRLDQLERLYSLAAAENVPLIVLGGGSNSLFSDHGFPGIVARMLGTFTEYRFDGEHLEAGAGALLPVLVRESAEHGLAGLECLAGVPGTLGGALVCNAGSRDEWIGSMVVSIDVLSVSGSPVRIAAPEAAFAYRTSALENRVILGVALNLKKGHKNDILNHVRERALRRAQTQPAGTWNAGSVFRNPPGESAGRLIEAVGLKGLKFGGAQVSEKHANFIVNTGDATSSDIRSLISTVRHKVKEQSGIDLELEIKIVGA